VVDEPNWVLGLSIEYWLWTFAPLLFSFILYFWYWRLLNYVLKIASKLLNGKGRLKTNS
jgi:hypothetical protein